MTRWIGLVLLSLVLGTEGTEASPGVGDILKATVELLGNDCQPNDTASTEGTLAGYLAQVAEYRKAKRVMSQDESNALYSGNPQLFQQNVNDTLGNCLALSDNPTGRLGYLVLQNAVSLLPGHYVDALNHYREFLVSGISGTAGDQLTEGANAKLGKITSMFAEQAKYPYSIDALRAEIWRTRLSLASCALRSGSGNLLQNCIAEAGEPLIEARNHAIQALQKIALPGQTATIRRNSVFAQYMNYVDDALFEELMLQMLKHALAKTPWELDPFQKKITSDGFLTMLQGIVAKPNAVQIQTEPASPVYIDQVFVGSLLQLCPTAGGKNAVLVNKLVLFPDALERLKKSYEPIREALQTTPNPDYRGLCAAVAEHLAAPTWRTDLRVIFASTRTADAADLLKEKISDLARAALQGREGAPSVELIQAAGRHLVVLGNPERGEGVSDEEYARIRNNLEGIRVDTGEGRFVPKADMYYVRPLVLW